MIIAIGLGLDAEIISSIFSEIFKFIAETIFEFYILQFITKERTIWPNSNITISLSRWVSSPLANIFSLCHVRASQNAVLRDNNRKDAATYSKAMMPNLQSNFYFSFFLSLFSFFDISIYISILLYLSS